MLAILGLLDTPSDGTYTLNSRPVSGLKLSERARIRNREIGFIFQAFNLIGDLTVYENVELPLTYRGMGSAERKKRVQEALERVGMSHRMKHYPSQLSGGQQQRVAVARALGGDPVILLADEPTGNLDSANGEAVMNLLKDLHRNGATICMVTHDPRYAQFADRTIRLFDGRIVEESVRGLAELVELVLSRRVPCWARLQAPLCLDAHRRGECYSHAPYWRWQAWSACRQPETSIKSPAGVILFRRGDGCRSKTSTAMCTSAPGTAMKCASSASRPPPARAC